MLRRYVDLADEEIFVKDYHIATIEEPDYGEAHVAITKLRVIMYTWTKDIIQINSADIKDVRSIDLSWFTLQRKMLGWTIFIIGSFLTFLILLQIPSLILNPDIWIYNWIMIAIELILPLLGFFIGLYFIRTKRHSFSIIINIKAATGALTFYSYSQEAVQRGLDPNKVELNARPGPEADVMGQELGALILTMQEE